MEPARLRADLLGHRLGEGDHVVVGAGLDRQDPVDVDPGVLESSSRMLLDEFAELTIHAICADFRDPAIALCDINPDDGVRTVVLFLGSSIGNLDFDAAVAMLASLRTLLAPGDALFLGADLKKSKAVLDPAYDDPLGVTGSLQET